MAISECDPLRSGEGGAIPWKEGSNRFHSIDPEKRHRVLCELSRSGVRRKRHGPKSSHFIEELKRCDRGFLSDVRYVMFQKDINKAPDFERSANIAGQEWTYWDTDGWSRQISDIVDRTFLQLCMIG
jgi:hypothetical protein